MVHLIVISLINSILRRNLLKNNNKDRFNTKGTQNSQEDTKTNNKMENGNRGHSNEEGDQHAVGNMVTCLIDKPHKQNVSLLTPNNSNLNFLGGSKQLYQNIT